MKFVWVIAIILGILFGFSVAASFLSALWLGALITGFLSSVFMAVSSLISCKFYDAIEWIIPAIFFGWLVSICF